MKYWVSVDGRPYEVAVNGDELLVEGETHRAAIHRIPDSPLVQLVVDGRAFLLAASPDGPGRWRLLHQGEPVEVEAVDERTQHIRAAAGVGHAPAGGGLVKAPMPGLVLRVLVEPEAVVEAGTGLVVLEAMKMENELKATAPGRVVRVAVRAGQVVEKGEVLVELGPGPD